MAHQTFSCEWQSASSSSAWSSSGRRHQEALDAARPGALEGAPPAPPARGTADGSASRRGKARAHFTRVPFGAPAACGRTRIGLPSASVAARIMPRDSTPMSLAGLRFATTTTWWSDQLLRRVGLADAGHELARRSPRRGRRAAGCSLSDFGTRSANCTVPTLSSVAKNWSIATRRVAAAARRAGARRGRSLPGRASEASAAAAGGVAPGADEWISDMNFSLSILGKSGASSGSGAEVGVPPQAMASRFSATVLVPTAARTCARHRRHERQQAGGDDAHRLEPVPEDARQRVGRALRLDHLPRLADDEILVGLGEQPPERPQGVLEGQLVHRRAIVGDDLAGDRDERIVVARQRRRPPVEGPARHPAPRGSRCCRDRSRGRC